MQLAICWKPRVSGATGDVSQASHSLSRVDGDNATGADDQQERSDSVAWWVVGFVDGEGCFAASVVRNTTCRLGWQVQREFSVTQGERSLAALTLLKRFFRCGTIIRNERHDNHREAVYRFSVRRWRIFGARSCPSSNHTHFAPPRVRSSDASCSASR